ncbi:MAG: L,D-transpeptidase, partial [Promicromonosporaceae bacterium]|nr:L,D-transpeptidase [Promicromonosporaceae bacterium]
LPPGIPQVSPSAATGQVATPKATLTAAYSNIGDATPVLALNSDTDNLLNMPAHWLVVGTQGDWIRVLTPVGRGALPSDDPSQVNHHAVWVAADDVTLTEATYRINVSVANRELTLTGPDGTHSFHVGVGVEGVTDSPTGLCAIVGPVTIQTGEPGLLTNCQSERLDAFEGATDAAFALHVYGDGGFDAATGGDVSNGCIRVKADDFATYLQNVPAGTPVVVE